MRKISVLGRSIGIEWILLFTIAAAGVCLRIEAQRHLVWIEPDGVAYVWGALNVHSGIRHFERRGPLFQLLLLGCYKIFGASYETTLVVPQFFGCILPILFFLVGKRFFDSETGLIAALLASLNPFLIVLSTWIFRETLALSLILTIILVAHSAVKIQSKRRSMIATTLLGFLSGLLILTREEMIFIISPACIAYLYICEKKRSDFMVKTSVVLMTTMIAMTPWLLYSHAHFGDPFYSYYFYMEGLGNGNSSGATNGAFVQRLLSRLLFGLWKQVSELPAIFAFISLVFLPIGIMFSIKRRVTWLVYFIMAFDLLILATFLGSREDRWFYWTELPYKFTDANRWNLPGVMPSSVIMAFGIRRFICTLTGSKRSEGVRLRKRRRRKLVINLRLFARMRASKRFIIFLCLSITLGAIVYVPPYILTLEDFDDKTLIPFIESAEFLNSAGGIDGVFTLHPELLERYYNGPIYKLPNNGGFDGILDEAEKKGVKYLIINSASVNSVDLIDLYYHSRNPEGEEIPSDFQLVKSGQWPHYGIYRLGGGEPRFKAAVFGHLEWDTHVPWETTLASMDASIETFADTTVISDVDLSDFDVVVFADFLRPVDDSERSYLEDSVQNGLVVIVSGISPENLAGGTSNLTRIATWFGATFHTEAPKEDRWKVKFTENATQILSNLDLNREYEFYTGSDWSTPVGALVKPESVVFAYRVDDGAPTIFLHLFGEGTSIFVGPRFGFESADKITFVSLVRLLILSALD